MPHKPAAETVAVALTLGILASPVRAEPVKMTDAQMDNVIAGAFVVSGGNPNVLIGFHNGLYSTLQSTDGGLHYTDTPGGVTWTTQILYISTAQGFAVGALSNAQGQYWDGEQQGPPNFVMQNVTVVGVLKPVG